MPCLMFFAVQMQNVMFEKVPKDCDVQAKRRGLRCFSLSEPRNRTKTLVFKMFSQQLKSERCKNTTICAHSQHNMSEMLDAIPRLLNRLFQNTGIYITFEKFHA